MVVSIPIWAPLCPPKIYKTATRRRTTSAGGEGGASKAAPRRRWDELCRDLLNSIYAKLPHCDRPDFGCICKSWRHIHASAATSPTTAPLAGRRAHPIDVGSHVGEDVPGGYRELLCSPNLRVFYSWASGWWLVGFEGTFGASVFGCFNPLLPWPYCYFRLPILRLRPVNRDPFPQQPPIKAAFSAPPTGPDWTVLIVNSRRSFSTFRRGRLWWDSYSYCRKGEEGKRVCEGIGYRDERFFLLFDTGDVLIFGIDGACSERRMLVAAAAGPLLAGELLRRENLCVVGATAEEESVVVSWERGGGGGGRSFRLVKVEKRVTPTAAAMKELQLEEGGRGGVLMAAEQPGAINRIHNCGYICLFLCSLGIFLIWMYVVIIIFVPALNFARYL